MSLIPTTVWEEPNALFVDRHYSGLKSEPEYGMNRSEKILGLLQPFSFSEMARILT